MSIIDTDILRNKLNLNSNVHQTVHTRAHNNTNIKNFEIKNKLKLVQHTKWICIKTFLVLL